KFTDKDGITAVRMKSPDVPLVNKEKGYSREIVRVINYKQGTDKTVINRIYQYVRFYGAPVHKIPKDSPVNDVPEYNGGANPIDPPVLEKPEYNGGANPIDPPILEKPELKFEYKLIDPPVLEKPEYNGGANPIDPPVLEKPEFKVPNTPEKPKTPEVSKPEKPKTDIPTNLPKPKENNPQNNNRVLPNTGLESSSSMAIIGTLALSIIGLTILKRRNN
ncbi:SIALI-17 repeat-containing surface protein, partial [Gemella sp.]